MSKIIVPLHFAKLNTTPGNVDVGFKKFYLRGEWFKLYNGITEIDVVLDRPLDNYVPIIGTITSSDTVLTAIEKLDYAISSVITPNILWGNITGNILAQTDLIAYIAALPTSTLQQVLDNNHDLVDGNNFQGTGAGVNNTGINVNALGDSAGFTNNFNNVNLFGANANADEDGQTVLSKDGTIMARISTTDLTATQKYNLPDASGTIALTSDITTPSLQQTITVNKTADEIELLYAFFTGKAFTPATSPPGYLLYSVAIKLAQNGGYYVYGNFNGYDGGASKGIVKILTNGQIDTSFATGTGLNNFPYAGTSLLEDNFGKLYISGTFTTYNSVSANRILKLNTDGSRDTSFNVGTGFNDYTLDLDFNVAKTAVYVTGIYNTYKGVSQNRLAKLLLNGDIDSSFIIGSGFNNATISIAVNSDDTLFITSYATTYKGLAIPNIIKLLPNGDRDFSFVSTGFSPSGYQANYLLKTPDNKIIAVGTHTSYNGTPTNGIIKINQDGTIDTSFVAGTGFAGIVPPGGILVSSIQLVDNDTKYLCTGYFTSFKGVPTNGTVLIDLVGNIIETYVNQYSTSLYVNNALLSLALSGVNIDKLVFIKNNVEYLTLNQSLTFNKTNGKAEYNLSPNLVYEDLGQNELVPKKFINRSVAKTTSFTAANSGIYSTNGTITVTDAVPETNQGYIVYVVGGTTTIGGVGYTTGSLVYRFFNGTAWTSTNMNSVGGITSVTATSPITSSGGTTPVISTSMATNKLIGRSTAGTGVMEEITIGTGLSLSAGTLTNTATYTSPLTTKGDIFVRNTTVDTRLPVGLNTQILIADSTTPTGLKWGTNTATTPAGYYGAFSDVTDQFAAVINTGYPMLLGVTDLTNGVTVVSGSRVTIANTGIYNIQWSAQFRNPTAAEHDVTIWLRKNGVDVPGSAGVVLVPKKHGAFDGHTLPSWNFLLDPIAGDYYEFVWSTADTNVFISFEPAGSPPPSTASVVLTVTQQSGIMAGTGMTALTTTGASGASTYNSGTGILNVPTYTLNGLGGAPKDEFSGLTPISSAALLALANTDSLVIGQVYKVEETKFYNNLSTVYVYVKATSTSTIDEENAIAEFYDPKYDSYSIYNTTLQYNGFDYVIWGGLIWTNGASIVLPGANINNYELGGGFNIESNPLFYNVVMDNVSYSIEFEMIYSRRNHYCNFTCDSAILLIGNVKIRNMQWGNYYNSGTSTGLRGINCLNSDFNIINSRVILLTEITLINSFVAVGNNRILDDLVFANSGTFASPNTIANNISSRFFANTMTATVGGLVPTPPNNTTTFLRGDGTFAAPTGGGVTQAESIAIALIFG
jgi:hypothetical protein